MRRLAAFLTATLAGAALAPLPFAAAESTATITQSGPGGTNSVTRTTPGSQTVTRQTGNSTATIIQGNGSTPMPSIGALVPGVAGLPGITGNADDIIEDAAASVDDCGPGSLGVESNANAPGGPTVSIDPGDCPSAAASASAPLPPERVPIPTFRDDQRSDAAAGEAQPGTRSAYRASAGDIDVRVDRDGGMRVRVGDDIRIRMD